MERGVAPGQRLPDALILIVTEKRMLRAIFSAFSASILEGIFAAQSRLTT
jgi:hypothetical protein